ncbi:MAG TPA: class I adenylate-forming enzyme family protein [Devosia sp.]|nr:class I adenylate-forming enzyme family protein [Devosia sp.]
MIYENLSSIAARAPAGNGLRLGNRTTPYTELAERIGRLASGFAERGIRTGDAVALIMHNGPDVFVAIHALFAIGAVAMPLSPSATRAEAATAAKKAKAVAIIAEAGSLALAAEVAEELGLPLPILGPDDIAELELTQPGKLPKLTPDTPAIYFSSSGSTGLPKLVPHTHGELLADAHRTSTAWQITSDDTVFNMLPSNFAMGLLLGLTDAAEAGATIVYWQDPRPLMFSRGAVLEAIAANRVSFYGAVPAMHEALAGAQGSHDLSALRLVFSGGAALPRKTFDLVRERLGITLRQAYGSSESLMFSHNDNADIEATWNSVGRPAGDGRARLAAVGGLPPGVGELLVRSSSLFTGYAGDDASNAVSFEDGWLRSGDLARLDNDGNLYIVGRSKLLIEVAGFKIDPIEVEAVLARHPAVSEAVVIGLKDGRGGQRLKALVVPRDEVAPEALVRFMRAELSEQKIPTLIEFRDALPKSTAGKILRSALVEETA